MKSAIQIFSELGVKLRTSLHDENFNRVVEDACQANEWFSPQDICQAVEAIVDDMLASQTLSEWLAKYNLEGYEPKNILVITAGNIPLVGFFDIMCVVASGHRCLVKPSSKDEVLTRYIISQIKEVEEQVQLEIYDGVSNIDAVIATGSDNAARYFKSQYATAPTLLRGTRHSVAVLSGHETAAELDALSQDIFSYSGLGCRNVSLVFLPHGMALPINVPPMNAKYHNNYLQNRAMMQIRGADFIDLDGALAVEQCEFTSALSVIAYCRYNNIKSVGEWIDANDSKLQCVVSSMQINHRTVPLGKAQHPRLNDYADDVDTMIFLTTVVNLHFLR